MNSPSEKPEINSKRILQDNPLWWDIGVYQAGLLLYVEPNIWLSFIGPDQSGHWQCTLAREIRRFRGITKIEEYMERRVLPRKVSNTLSVPNTSAVNISAQNVQLHPAIHTKCWSLYTQGDYDNAIFNATKAIEVAVRSKARLTNDLVGASLIAQAFKTDNPILTYSAVKAEQEEMMAVLAT